MKIAFKKYEIESDTLSVTFSKFGISDTRRIALKEIDVEHYLVKECLDQIKLCVGSVLKIKVEGHEIKAEKSIVESMLGDLRKN